MVFDLDGLLVDSEPLWHRAERAVFARHGIALSVAQCRSTKGRFVGEVTAHWVRVFGRDDLDPGELAEEVVEAVAALLATEATQKPGVEAALRACEARGWPRAVASSSPRRLIEVALGAQGLSDRFALWCSAEEVGAGKPDPAVYLRAAEALGVPPGRCLAIEDSPTGVAAAKAAGMTCLAVPEERLGGEAVPVVWPVAPDAVLESLGSLAGWLVDQEARRQAALVARAGE